MQRKQFSATVTDTGQDQDLGTFEAIVSAWEADRKGDVIDRRAFDATIAAWIGSGKAIPLLFEHSATVVGSVDPASMSPTDAGLVVAGEVDRSTDEGQQVWRTIKSGTAGFSIGFMSKARPLPAGGRELVEIDLLEISATSKPMHPATRALSWKSAADTDALVEREGEALLATFRDLERRHKAGEFDVKAAPAAAKSTAPVQIATFDC
jgi:HK97 family phage prohead protease